MTKLATNLMLVGFFSILTACGSRSGRPGGGEIEYKTTSKPATASVAKLPIASLMGTDHTFDKLASGGPDDVATVVFKTFHEGRFELNLQFKNGNGVGYSGCLNIDSAVSETISVLALDPIGRAEFSVSNTEPRMYCAVLAVTVAMGDENSEKKPMQIRVCETKR